MNDPTVFHYLDKTDNLHYLNKNNDVYFAENSWVEAILSSVNSLFFPLLRLK